MSAGLFHVIVGVTLFTTCDMGFDVSPLNVASPEYVALIPPLFPTTNDDTITLACPAMFSATVPKFVPPISKLTVPVGVPVSGATAVTVAVNVTGWPKADGLGEEVMVARLLNLFTVCEAVADTLELKLLSPT